MEHITHDENSMEQAPSIEFFNATPRPPENPQDYLISFRINGEEAGSIILELTEKRDKKEADKVQRTKAVRMNDEDISMRKASEIERKYGKDIFEKVLEEAKTKIDIDWVMLEPTNVERISRLKEIEEKA